MGEEVTRLQQIHEHSIKAYHEEGPKLSKREGEIVEYLRVLGPRTDRELMQVGHYPDMNCVRPRVTTLLQRGVLMEVGEVVCPVTKKTVRRVDIRGQRKLFQ